MDINNEYLALIRHVIVQTRGAELNTQPVEYFAYCGAKSEIFTSVKTLLAIVNSGAETKRKEQANELLKVCYEIITKL